jgi:hypothetical protein
VIDRDQAGIVASSMTSDGHRWRAGASARPMTRHGAPGAMTRHGAPGECQNAKNPPRSVADGFPSRRADSDKNTMVDRTGQAKFRVFIHRL